MASRSGVAKAAGARERNPHAETWIALLRGVNVVGRNKLPMKEFTALLEGLGHTKVRTYIQSGNAVFRAAPARSKGGREAEAAGIASAIARTIGKRFGFEPGVIVLSKQDLARAAAANPFPDAEAEGRMLHLFFMSAAPGRIDAAGLDAVKIASERWHTSGNVFYLHTPEGFGNSKLAAKVERCLGVPSTARNWRTVSELLKLTGGED